MSTLGFAHVSRLRVTSLHVVEIRELLTVMDQSAARGLTSSARSDLALARDSWLK